MHFIIVPGLDGSDHNHWQSRWESDWLPGATRIAPGSWTHPDLDDWTTAIDHAVKSSADDVVLITHSLGCHAAGHWLSVSPLASAVRGVFMAAPPDQLAPTFPTALLPTFTSIVPAPLEVPAVLIASEDDPYCTVGAATRLATAWAVPLITTGLHGHLNSDSNLGLWPAGQDLLVTFLSGLGISVADDS